MAQKIPQSFLNDLLAQTNIVTIAQQRLSLKKSGDNYHCKCPFHQENSPSFSISEKKQFFYCFGCGEHGNAIGFIMRYDRIDFRAAVDMLAAQAGMTVPTTHHDSHQAHYELMAQCQTLYVKQMQQAQAQQYIKQRQIPAEIAEQYQIGFAPPGWQFIENHIQGKNSKTLLTLGMLIQSQKEHRRCYDRFRERIMFPIRNERGKVIAFGGRSIGQQEPKYLNSPETPIFHKRQAIYGIYEAKQNSPSTLTSLIVVEGYMDVIAMASHGIRNTVATLGTAITADHLTQLFRHTQQLIFCFDGDMAGQKAAWKACELCLTLMHDGRDVSFLCLPTKEDPDSLLRAQGAKAMHELLKSVIPISDYFFTECANQYNTEQLAGKAAFAKAAQQALSKCPEGIFKSLMYDKLSKMIGLPVNAFNTAPAPSAETPQPPKRPLPLKRNQSLPSPMQQAITLLLHYPTIGTTLDLAPYSTGPWLPSGEAWELLSALVTCIKQHPTNINTGTLLHHFSEHPRIDALAKLAAHDLITPEDGAKDELLATLQQYLRQITSHRIDLLIDKSKREGLDSNEKVQLQTLIQAKNDIKT